MNISAKATISIVVAFYLTNVCSGAVIIGDVNQDGSVDLLDVAPFVDAISNSEYQIEADMNEDGSVDLLDVSGFIDVLSGNAPKIAILKDTLDVENFENTWASGGYFSQDSSNGSAVDGRSFFGYVPDNAGRLRNVTFYFWAGIEATGGPNNNPNRFSLFDLSIAQYHTFDEAEANPTRVDGFFF